MLVASSLSVLSQSVASTGYSESVDLELVDEIIERSPRTATTFPLVYKAYVSVLEDHNLSPANDTAYYQFLLKLQVIRAGTWGEKWDLWRATNFRPPASGLAHGRKSASPRVRDTPRLADVRARVPFLSGASSDLDEAFGDTSYSADGESVAASEPIPSAYKSGAGVLRRPSPRRNHTGQHRQEGGHDHSRSLIGYTPDTSLEFSPLGLDLLPARTSTPVHAQYRDPGVTPPPYSISEAPNSPSEQYDLTETSTQLVEGLATPKASASEWEEQRRLEEEVVREMERRADQFFETGLLGRCFDVWVQANDWIQRTTEQIDTVRANILLRQYLQKWRDKHDRVLSLPNTADQHRRRNLQAQALSIWIRRAKDISLLRREESFVASQTHGRKASAFGRWRMEIHRRRTHRWEKDMRTREKRLLKSREEVLMRDVLDRWRGEARTRIDTRQAEAFDRQRLLGQMLEAWHYRLEQKERLEGQLAVFCRSKDRRILSQTMSTWIGGARLGQAEALWSERTNQALIVRVWDHWRVMSLDQAKADAFFRRQSLVRALRSWMVAHNEIRAMERKAVIFRQVGDQLILRRALTAWTVSEREVLLVRVRDQRLLKDALSGWRYRMDRLRELEMKIVAFQAVRTKAVLDQATSTWTAVLTSKRAQHKQAAALHNARQLSSAMQTWRAASAKISHDRERADKARAFFVLRQVFKVWKAEMNARKQEHFIKAKELILVRCVFDGWRTETQRSIEEDRKVDQFQDRAERRVLASMLARWTDRVIALKSRQLDISEQRDTHLLQSALANWNRARGRVADLQALGDSFLIVKGEDRLREALTIWRGTASRKQQRREAAITAERARKKRLIDGAWTKWRERVEERRLAPIEEEVAIRHEDAVLFQVWDRWKARATLLPAISYDNRRIKKKAWTSLCRAMQRARMSKEFGGPRDRRLLEDVLAIWREKTQVKVVTKAGRLRGRFRPSLPPVTPAIPTRSTLKSPRLPEVAPPYHARPPSRTAQHVRSLSQHRHIRTEPASPRLDDADLESVGSEPAYSRLRSELSRPRGRGASEEAVTRVSDGPVEHGGRSVSVVAALKSGVPRR